LRLQTARCMLGGKFGATASRTVFSAGLAGCAAGCCAATGLGGFLGAGCAGDGGAGCGLGGADALVLENALRLRLFCRLGCAALGLSACDAATLRLVNDLDATGEASPAAPSLDGLKRPLKKLDTVRVTLLPLLPSPLESPPALGLLPPLVRWLLKLCVRLEGEGGRGSTSTRASAASLFRLGWTRIDSPSCALFCFKVGIARSLAGGCATPASARARHPRLCGMVRNLDYPREKTETKV
jgi:hypothetical protein